MRTHLKVTALTLIAGLTTSVSAFALNLNAKAYYVAHAETGTPVLQKNAEQKIGPASLTKLMTAYLLFDALKKGEITLDSQLPISEKAWRKGGSKMFLEVGKTVRVEDLIKGIIVVSGNDACIVAAEYLGGKEEAFAEMMNEAAAKIGMENTNFMNASGWPDPNQYSTAKDMFKLAQAIVNEFPEYYEYFSIEKFEYSNIKQPNRNGLLKRNVGVDGMKTGHIEEAGFHMVASAKRGDTRLISTILGTNSFSARENESLSGLNYGFRTHKMVNLVEKGAVVAEAAPVWLGQKEAVKLVAEKDLSAFIAKKDQEKIDAEVIYENPLTAPIAEGQVVGTIKITHPSTGEVYESNILSAEGVEELGFFAKLWAKFLAWLGF